MQGEERPETRSDLTYVGIYLDKYSRKFFPAPKSFLTGLRFLLREYLLEGCHPNTYVKADIWIFLVKLRATNTEPNLTAQKSHLTKQLINHNRSWRIPQFLGT
jgi:hypothetical protein